MELSGLQLRPMTEKDIKAGMKLKEFAGWNQSEADWRRYIEIEPNGCFAGEMDGLVVATGTAFNYENRFGWIGMILVDPEYRRRGIATIIMGRLISYLEAGGCSCQKLDATEAGTKVYSRMGFETEYQVERWSLDCAEPRQPPAPIHHQLSSLSQDQLPAIEDLDRTAFGAPRTRLVKRYLKEGRFNFVCGDPAHPDGFVLGRQGSNAYQIGPLVARTAEVGRTLLQAALRAVGGMPVILDIPLTNPHIVGFLEKHGFERRRTLNRMYRGANRHPGKPEQVFCLAGFEFG